MPPLPSIRCIIHFIELFRSKFDGQALLTLSIRRVRPSFLLHYFFVLMSASPRCSWCRKTSHWTYQHSEPAFHSSDPHTSPSLSPISTYPIANPRSLPSPSLSQHQEETSVSDSPLSSSLRADARPFDPRLPFVYSFENLSSPPPSSQSLLTLSSATAVSPLSHAPLPLSPLPFPSLSMESSRLAATPPPSSPASPCKATPPSSTSTTPLNQFTRSRLPPPPPAGKQYWKPKAPQLRARQLNSFSSSPSSSPPSASSPLSSSISSSLLPPSSHISHASASTTPASSRSMSSPPSSSHRRHHLGPMTRLFSPSPSPSPPTRPSFLDVVKGLGKPLTTAFSASTSILPTPSFSPADVTLPSSPWASTELPLSLASPLTRASTFSSPDPLSSPLGLVHGSTSSSSPSRSRTLERSHTPVSPISTPPSSSQKRSKSGSRRRRLGLNRHELPHLHSDRLSPNGGSPGKKRSTVRGQGRVASRLANMFDMLPTEIVHHIFTFLPLTEPTLFLLAEVCHYFLDTLACFVRSLDFTSAAHSTFLLPDRVFGLLPLLHQVSHVAVGDFQLQHSESASAQLQQTTTADTTSLFRSLARMPSLRSLTVDLSDVTPTDAQALAPLATITSLSALQFYHPTLVPSFHMPLPSLVWLKLVSCPVTDAHLVQIANFLPNLTSLNLQGAPPPIVVSVPC